MATYATFCIIKVKENDNFYGTELSRRYNKRRSRILVRARSGSRMISEWVGEEGGGGGGGVRGASI